ncbi:MAG TPA: FAD binding domain-containing protein [Actinomycetota bacterium]|nr:FAD binding domain-containing protein [Actinomycetota bacterium]
MSPSFTSASTLDDALAAVASGARPVAGGTDLVVGARQGKAPLPNDIVAIDRVEGLRALEISDAGLRLGTLVTHGDIVANADIRNRFTALADASAIVGSHATRAQGTIGGNVMNASPAMDTGGPLLCFDATVTLRSAKGERTIGLDALWTGPGKTSAAPDELLVSVDLPAPGEGTGSCYVRLEYRRQMEIAVVGATAVVVLGDGNVADARIAITALTPTIRRVPAAEKTLVGTAADADAVKAAARATAAAATPISDVRGSAEYRRAMAEVMATRAIAAALTRARGGSVPIPASPAMYGAKES